MADTTPTPDPVTQPGRLTAPEIADEMWAEANRLQLGASLARVPLIPSALPEASAAGMPVVKLPLSALLNLDGEDFAEAAYATILGRHADRQGMKILTVELARGTNKIELLGRLQRSAEARAAGLTVPGLQRRYLVRRLGRVPVAGVVLRLAAAALRRTGVSSRLAGKGQRDLELRAEFEAGLRRNQAGTQAQLDAITQHLSAAMGKLTQQQAGLDAANTAAAAAAARGALLSDALAQARAEIASAAAEARGAVAVAQRQLQGAVDALAQRLPPMQQAFQVALDTAGTQTRAAFERLDLLDHQVVEAEARLGAAIAILADRTDTHARTLGALDDATIAERIDSARTRLREDLGARLARAEAALDRTRQGPAVPQAAPVQAAAPAPDHALDSLYVAFEDRFRGSRDAIRDRQRAYLPVLAEAGAGQPNRPVLDVGCGRGEFLELLNGEGLAARGVDSNEAMVEACRQRGLDCTAGDAVAFMAAQPEGSLGAVTGFHIIEHLPFELMVRLLDEALRALAPGGVVIFETPNPANVLTASRWFWLDPTHHHPLPGEMVAMVAEARGFASVSILELHPNPSRFDGADTVLVGQLDALFYGPQDYALIARKP